MCNRDILNLTKNFEFEVSETGDSISVIYFPLLILYLE